MKRSEHSTNPMPEAVRGMDTAHNPIIVFDGVCNFCNYWVNFVLKRDHRRRFRFAALQSETGTTLCEKFAGGSQYAHTVLLIHDDRVWIKSTAAVKILRLLGGVYRLSVVGYIVPRPIRDLAYDLIAKYRYRLFGRRTECRVPIPSEYDRFLP